MGGCKHLDQLDHDYPENLELRGARDTFVTTAMRPTSKVSTTDGLKGWRP